MNFEQIVQALPRGPISRVGSRSSSTHSWTGTSVTLGEVAGSVGASSKDTVLVESGGGALVNGGAGAAASAASTRSAMSAIQPDIELEERKG